MVVSESFQFKTVDAAMVSAAHSEASWMAALCERQFNRNKAVILVGVDTCMGNTQSFPIGIAIVE